MSSSFGGFFLASREPQPIRPLKKIRESFWKTKEKSNRKHWENALLQIVTFCSSRYCKVIFIKITLWRGNIPLRISKVSSKVIVNLTLMMRSDNPLMATNTQKSILRQKADYQAIACILHPSWSNPRRPPECHPWNFLVQEEKIMLLVKWMHEKWRADVCDLHGQEVAGGYPKHVQKGAVIYKSWWEGALGGCKINIWDIIRKYIFCCLAYNRKWLWSWWRA